LATSIAVTIPLCSAIADATALTTRWSGAACNRMGMEYDDAVGGLMGTINQPAGYSEVSSRRR
jgi:hypothetical protein